jgi:hypothetical protein
MKIFSIKRMIGLAAVAGAVAYARKNGGFKNAFNQLVKKGEAFAKDISAKQKQPAESMSGFKSEPATTSSSSYIKNGYDTH